jgi:hypothetical protein
MIPDTKSIANALLFQRFAGNPAIYDTPRLRTPLRSRLQCTAPLQPLPVYSRTARAITLKRKPIFFAAANKISCPRAGCPREKWFSCKRF